MKNKSQKTRKTSRHHTFAAVVYNDQPICATSDTYKRRIIFTEWCLLLEYRHTVCVQQGTPTGIGFWSGL